MMDGMRRVVTELPPGTICSEIEFQRADHIQNWYLVYLAEVFELVSLSPEHQNKRRENWTGELLETRETVTGRRNHASAKPGITNSAMAEQNHRGVSVQRLVAEELVDAFNRMDIDEIMSKRADGCMRHILPASLGQKPTNNDQYRATLQSLRPIFKNFRLTVHDVLEDRDARRVSMYLKARADTLAGEYLNEYQWTMTFDETGQKIVHWTEFVDSSIYHGFWPKLSEAMRLHSLNGTS